MFTEGVRPVLGRVIRHFRPEDRAASEPGLQIHEVEALGVCESAHPRAAIGEINGAPEHSLIPEFAQENECAREAELIRLSQSLLDLSEATSLAALNLSLQAARLGEPGKEILDASASIGRLSNESKEASERLYELLTVMEQAA